MIDDWTFNWPLNNNYAMTSPVGTPPLTHSLTHSLSLTCASLEEDDEHFRAAIQCVSFIKLPMLYITYHI